MHVTKELSWSRLSFVWILWYRSAPKNSYTRPKCVAEVVEGGLWHPRPKFICQSHTTYLHHGLDAHKSIVSINFTPMYDYTSIRTPKLAKNLWCQCKLIHCKRWEHSELIYNFSMHVFRWFDSRNDIQAFESVWILMESNWNELTLSLCRRLYSITACHQDGWVYIGNMNPKSPKLALGF